MGFSLRTSYLPPQLPLWVCRDVVPTPNEAGQETKKREGRKKRQGVGGGGLQHRGPGEGRRWFRVVPGAPPSLAHTVASQPWAVRLVGRAKKRERKLRIYTKQKCGGRLRVTNVNKNGPYFPYSEGEKKGVMFDTPCSNHDACCL